MKEVKIFSHGSLKEYETDGDDLDKYYLPARALNFGIQRKKGEDRLILLPNNPDVQIYSEHYNQILRSLLLKNSPIIFIPDTNYILDIAINSYLTCLKSLLSKDKNYSVWPYATTEETLVWINKLKSDGYSIKSALPPKIYFDNLFSPSHRGGWGRHISNPGKKSFPEIAGIPYPVSWIAGNFSELLEAYQRVISTTNSETAYLKPIFSAGGFTITRINNKKELKETYQKLFDSGALNLFGEITPVELQAAIEAEEFYSLQYTNGQIVGISKQIIDGTQWQGNIFNNVPPPIIEQAKQIFTRFRAASEKVNEPLIGWGGLDFAYYNSQLIVLEHNGRRVTGAHPALALAQILEVKRQPFITRKAPGEVACDLRTLWELARQKNLFFNPQRKTGIFPIIWMPGAGMLFSTAPTIDEADHNLDFLYNSLNQEKYIQ